MEIKFIYPRWGSADIAWPVFLEKVKKSGYHGVEIDLPLDSSQRKEVLAILKDFELDFVGQHCETGETDFNKHKDSFKRYVYNLAEGKPILINSHTGKDFFSFSQNAELIELGQSIEEETGVPVTHETHRSRFSFAAHVCNQYLKELPFLKLSSDFSHWCCVAESMLENQKEAVQRAIKHTYHVHARVGSSQSPQVIDPRDSTYRLELAQFKKWWISMLKNAEDTGRSFITVTPEYGPVPYAQVHPETQELLANQWDVNQFVKKELINELEGKLKF